MTLFLINLSRPAKIIFLIISDFFVGFTIWVIFGSPMATYLSSEMQVSFRDLFFDQILTFIYPIFLSIFYLFISGFYKPLTRFKSSGEGFFKAFFGAVIFGLSYIIFFVSSFKEIQTNFLLVFIIQGALLGSIFLAGTLFTREFAKYLLLPKSKADGASHIIIYGAGDIGSELFKALEFDNTREVIAFYDDSRNMIGATKFGVPVVSSFKALKKLKKGYPDLQVYLAAPSLTSLERREIIQDLELLDLSVFSVPTYNQLISDNHSIASAQQLSLEDLLPSGRIEKINFDYIQKKTLLITGAGGSIGSELVRQILTSKPKTLILFEQSEYNLFKIEHECLEIIKDKAINNVEVKAVLGDVRKLNQVMRTFHDSEIDIVFHAAAYKHVPLVEMPPNIIPSMENNVIGTLNMCKAAAEFCIDRFVLVSSDKAVRPTNIMGASKRLAELICQGFAKEFSQTIFSMVRFGNVINSSGSVIPMFRDQIAKGGPVTITHKEITRYFMTIPEAASLVIAAGINAVGGEVFLLDMGQQIKVHDLAKRMIRLSGRSVSNKKDDGGIEIIEIGLRPGEKMFEELLISGNEEKTINDKIYKSIETSLSFEDMMSVITELHEYIESLNINGIKNILKSQVDGYNPQS